MKYKHLGFAITGAFFYVVGTASHIVLGRFSIIGVVASGIILFLAVDKLVKQRKISTHTEENFLAEYRDV